MNGWLELKNENQKWFYGGWTMVKENAIAWLRNRKGNNASLGVLRKISIGKQ